MDAVLGIFRRRQQPHPYDAISFSPPMLSPPFVPEIYQPQPMQSSMGDPSVALAPPFHPPRNRVGEVVTRNIDDSVPWASPPNVHPPQNEIPTRFQAPYVRPPATYALPDVQREPPGSFPWQPPQNRVGEPVHYTDPINTMAGPMNDSTPLTSPLRPHLPLNEVPAFRPLPIPPTVGSPSDHGVRPIEEPSQSRIIEMVENPNTGTTIKGSLYISNDLEELSNDLGALKDLNSDLAKRTVWHVYNEKSSKEDGSFLKGINESMDVLLIFSGLFSATAAAFLSFTLPLIRLDNSEVTNQLLLSIFHKLDNASYALPSVPDFRPSPNAIFVNLLLFTSIAGNLLVAFFVILTKQWVRSIQERLNTIDNQFLQARIRLYRMEGVREWHFQEITSLLPVILHCSLALFAIGVVDFLWIQDNRTLASATLIILLLGVASYLVLSALPLRYPRAPFWSPLSAILNFLLQLAGNILRFFHLVDWNTSSNELDNSKMDHLFGNKTTISRALIANKAIGANVLMTLLDSADKDTEVALLYACLREMRVLSSKGVNPTLFNHAIVFQTWSYLAKTCLLDQKEVQLVQGKEANARFLCRVLEWLGTLTLDPSLQENFRLIGDEGGQLCQALFNTGVKAQDIRDMIFGHVARATLNHMWLPPFTCKLCIGGISTQARTIEQHLEQVSTTGWSSDISRSYRKAIITYITAQTRCLVHFAPRESPSEEARQRVTGFISKFSLGRADILDNWGMRRTEAPIMHIGAPVMREAEVAHAQSWLADIRRVRALS